MTVRVEASGGDRRGGDVIGEGGDGGGGQASREGIWGVDDFRRAWMEGRATCREVGVDGSLGRATWDGASSRFGRASFRGRWTFVVSALWGVVFGFQA